MTTYRHVRHARARVLLCALCAALAALLFAFAPRLPHARASFAVSRKTDARQDDGGRVDIRLRSLTTRATGRLTIEPSEGGGRVRMTALNLPDPHTVTPGANTYVVWAVSGGRILRLGELKRDERGNGGLAFERPEGFDRYGVIVTAEPDANAEHPGDPVLTTRADEAAALYPVLAPDKNVPALADDSAKTNAPDKTSPSNKSNPSDNASPSDTKAARDNAPASERTRVAGAPVSPPAPRSRARGARAGGFYAEVEDAIDASGGGRVVEFEGDAAAPGAGGAARAAYQRGSAYVRANFRGVPLPSSVGAGVYVLWGVLTDGRIIYMGSLPATEDLNRAEVYVRVAGFDADDYTLFVTAESARPAHVPSERRVLRPKNASFIVK
jgi:hypothetical protein